MRATCPKRARPEWSETRGGGRVRTTCPKRGADFGELRGSSPWANGHWRGGRRCREARAGRERDGNEEGALNAPSPRRRCCNAARSCGSMRGGTLLPSGAVVSRRRHATFKTYLKHRLKTAGAPLNRSYKSYYKKPAPIQVWSQGPFQKPFYKSRSKAVGGSEYQSGFCMD